MCAAIEQAPGEKYNVSILLPCFRLSGIKSRWTRTEQVKMSSVDGSRVASKLTCWLWSGAVFCPAYRRSRLGLLALMESANKFPSAYQALTPWTLGGLPLFPV